MSASESFLNVNGIRLHMLAWPAAAGCRPAVLLHGLSSNARIWELMAPRLASGGLAPVAIDLRGHGLSDKPETGYDFASFGGDIAGAVRALGLEAPMLIGHSLGAYLALELARPSNGVLPTALVLVDGGVSQMRDLPGVTWEEMRDRLTPPRLAGTPLDDLRRRMASPDRAWRPDEQALDILLGSFALPADGTITPHLTFERHMLLVRALWDFPTYERLSAVRCPILAILAKPPGDASTVEAGHLAAKQRGLEVARAAGVDLSVCWMEDTVHDIPLQRPEALAQRILDFAGGPLPRT
jgi:pimeloyl-ACP methyl ester carboxylesterase